MQNIDFIEPKGQAWEDAKLEKNWLIFGIFEADEKGKVQKRPVKASNKAMNLGIHAAAAHTFEYVLEQVQYQRERGFDKINKSRKEYADGNDMEFLKMVDVAIGYCPRPGSAMIVVDLDDCVDPKGNVHVDWVSMFLMFMDEGYVELSTSGTGMRVLMPRVDGDDKRFRSNGEYGGAGIFGGGGKGCVITGQPWEGRDTVTREEEALLTAEKHIAEVRNKVRERVLSGEGGGSLQDDVLNFGFTPIEVFREMVEASPNGSDIGAEWYGMIMAAREHFALQDLEDEDELYNILNEWSEKWEGGIHDEDKLRDVFDRPIRIDASGGMGMGSWYELAFEAGWEPRPHDSGENPNEDQASSNSKDSSGGDLGQLSDSSGGDFPPVATGRIDTVAKFTSRFVIAGGRWFDLLRMDERPETEVGNETMSLKMKHINPVNGKASTVKPNMAARQYWCKTTAEHYDGTTWYPGLPRVIKGKLPVEGRLVEAQGQKWINTWEPPLVGPQAEGSASVNVWKKHVMKLYPDEAEEIFDWLALCLQRPGQKIGFAMVLAGTPGSGKDSLVQPVLDAIGRSADGQVNFAALASDFDDWAYRRTLVVVQEANQEGRQQNLAGLISKMRAFIAIGRPIWINPKFLRGQFIPNVMNMIVTANEINALNIPPDDRRFFVCWTDADPMTTEEKHELFGWYENGGTWEVVRWLMDRKVVMQCGDSPRVTDGRIEMVRESMPAILDTVIDIVGDREWVSTSEISSRVVLEYDNNPRKMGRDIAKCLVFLGMHRRKNPSGDRGRINVQHIWHTIFAKRDMDVADWKEVKRVLNEDGVEGMN